ncbi:helix-turn-helix domain-containing protein [Nocardia altamirensis]|uniref:helix-turn-helix domain-containing protein n=1 Tax=Nocardia altamirensis TaxID=472158 RepID=UPI000840843A|nr:helix-turn-helix domain-containing protein [Nocardia altamirensis]
MFLSDDGDFVEPTERSASVDSSRTVLQGAFSILETLAHAPEGLRVMELVVATGLPKTTVRRHIAQLLEMNAVRKVGTRYLVGSTLATLGSRWQPDAALRRAVTGPVHRLADLSRTMVAVHVLEAGQLPMVTVAIPHSRTALVQPADLTEVAARTAVGRVLFGTQPDQLYRLRESWSDKEIRQLRTRLAEPRPVVIDQQDAAVGICCAAAPIRLPNGDCVAAVTAMVLSRTLRPVIADLVVRATADINRALAHSEWDAH